jgi:hypothetical protein
MGTLAHMIETGAFIKEISESQLAPLPCEDTKGREQSTTEMKGLIRI